MCSLCINNHYQTISCQIMLNRKLKSKTIIAMFMFFFQVLKILDLLSLIVFHIYEKLLKKHYNLFSKRLYNFVVSPVQTNQ